MPDVDFKLNWLLSSVCGCCSFSSLWHANGCCGMLIEGMLGFSFLASDGHCKALWASGSVCAVQKWWIIMFAYSSCIIWHTIDISVVLCAVNYRASRMLLTTTKVVAAVTSSATWVSIFSADFFFFHQQQILEMVYHGNMHWTRQILSGLVPQKTQLIKIKW